MSDYTIHPLSDKDGNPITRDPYIPELGDYMLVSTPKGYTRYRSSGAQTPATEPRGSPSGPSTNPPTGGHQTKARLKWTWTR